MADALNVPPTDDFTAYTGLVSKLGDHLGPMVAWAGKECSDTDGLDGMLTVIKSAVPEVASLFGGKLKQCHDPASSEKGLIWTMRIRRI